MRSITESNQVNLSEVSKRLTELQGKLNLDNSNLEKLLESFKHFGIRPNELAPGEAELYVEIPGEFFDFELGDFGKELKDLDFILRTFSEIALNEVPKSPVIRQISSSDPTLFLALAPGAILFTLKCLNMVLDSYKKVVEIRNLSASAKNTGLSAKILESIEAEAKEVVTQSIDKFTKEVENTYLKTEREGGREKELSSQLEKTLQMLAFRVDHGYRIEARIEPLPAPADDAEGAEGPEGPEGPEYTEKKLAYEQATEIEMLADKVAYFEPQGEPILRLPATGASEDQAETANTQKGAEEAAAKKSTKPTKSK